MIVNKYASRCDNCGKPVSENEGFVDKVGEDWVVTCTPCILSSRGTRPETVKCVVCTLMKRTHLVNDQNVCVDCA
jgi:hypothetical protein